MVQLIREPTALPSPAPAQTLGAVLRHLHRSGSFPPGTLPLVGSMVAFVSFLERRVGIGALQSVEACHVRAFILDERPLVRPLAEDPPGAALQLFFATCLELGLSLSHSVKGAL